MTAPTLFHVAILRTLLIVAALVALESNRLEAAAPEPTQKIASAAAAFLDTLDDTQRGKVSFAFNDAAQRIRWSNLPVSMAEHRGLRMGDLKANQRDAVMNLLATTLSKMGYEKVVGIVESDEVLRKQSPKGAPPFGRDEYFISFLGKPSATEPWMIQFGGHHLALNITIAGEQGVLTPSLIAVQPAKFTLDGKTIRPMGRETDKALELVQALTDEQRKQAILGSQMRDLVLGPGHDGETIQPEGLKTSTLNEAQRKLLLELIAEWSGIIHDTAATAKLNEIKANLADTWFAWSGPLEAGKAYFRIQGPTVIIEYAPQRLGGDVTMHIHSMFRDPTNDYGKKFAGK
ncbi:MAG TPA: DUF3500 domain-containing protein [Methylomirabilota bacterium]|nr:DUF3500 domain-containing protein [Methylomirabilota bacterium]